MITIIMSILKSCVIEDWALNLPTNWENVTSFQCKITCLWDLCYFKTLSLDFTKKDQTTLETHCVPLPVIELGAACHADKDVFFADLHQRDAVLQGQHKPVIPGFGVSIENCTFWVKRAKLKGWLDTAEAEKQNTIVLNSRKCWSAEDNMLPHILPKVLALKVFCKLWTSSQFRS